MSDLHIADKWGRVLPTSQHFKKAEAPRTGVNFGSWAGRDLSYATLPGGATLQFDLSRLTLEDFRGMRTHYQINASLTVLSFMIHQLDWHIECENKKISDLIETNMRARWTELVRGLTQAFWAGFSPNVIEYKNNTQTMAVEISRFKDLVPEECWVNWEKVEGYAPDGQVPPSFLEYNGIIQGRLYPSAMPMGGDGSWWPGSIRGQLNPIPSENTLWYPLLMENGDYYGRKLLKPAFPSWFFSMLIHLFANRYFERFGEPVPVGRAPFEDEVEVDGKAVSGRTAMETILTSLRNRSVVVLPSDRDPVTKEFDYSLDYIESQMRGADFERYMSRLDEEMSLSIFTPVLLFRTADVGSYNLGVSHMQIFLWMLNSLAGDIKQYLDEFVIARLKDYNFGPNAPIATWEYRKMGRTTEEILKVVANEVVRTGMAKPDLEDLGAAVGMKFNEIKQIVADPAAPGAPGGPGDPGGQPSTAKPAQAKPSPGNEAGGK